MDHPTKGRTSATKSRIQNWYFRICWSFSIISPVFSDPVPDLESQPWPRFPLKMTSIDFVGDNCRRTCARVARPCRWCRPRGWCRNSADGRCRHPGGWRRVGLLHRGILVRTLSGRYVLPCKFNYEFGQRNLLAFFVTGIICFTRLFRGLRFTARAVLPPWLPRGAFPLREHSRRRPRPFFRNRTDFVGWVSTIVGWVIPIFRTGTCTPVGSSFVTSNCATVHCFNSCSSVFSI